MATNRDQTINDLLNKMTLEEKVGQCFTFSWRGHLITPSIVEVITKLHAGGLRIEPYTTESATSKYYGRTLTDPNFVPPEDYAPTARTYFKAKHPGAYIQPNEYAAKINELQRIATGRPSGIPLHIALDYEGDFSHDYPFGGMAMFPAYMGMSSSGNPEIATEVAYAMGRQLRSIGVTMMHSPVCDINVNPMNPEIGQRSFSDKAEVVAEYVAKIHEGLTKAGIVATGKHFPGRGDSDLDAHKELDIITVDRETMLNRELVPYKKLIAGGLQAIMSAHSAYPSLDDDETPATLSKKIIRDVLRGELGFKGVITTDAMGMGAIVNRWGIPKACVLAVKAGCNLMLVKNDDDVRAQCFYEMKRAVETGELPEETLNESVKYVLGMKYDQGLIEDKGQVAAAAAKTIVGCDEIRATEKKAAEAALTLIRDNEGLLPLTQDQKVLVIEQMVPLEFTPNDTSCNPHKLNEEMLAQSMNIINATTDFCATPEQEELLMDVANEADCIVITNFDWRITPGNNSEFVKKLIAAGHKVVVLTNTPYSFGVPEEAGTVLCTFGAMSGSLKAAANCLYGKIKATGKVPVELGETATV